MKSAKKKYLTWPDIDRYLKKHPEDAGIIIPIGPVEEHGPHLPVTSDIITAEAMANLAVEGTHYLVFPSIPLMVCGISKEVSGTYSIEPETLHLITRDLVNQLAKKGFRKILFFTGHGGYSMIVVRKAIAEVHEMLPGVRFKADVMNFEEACPHQAQIVGVDDRDLHAAGTEVPRVQFLCHNSVKFPLPTADYHGKDENGKLVLSKSGICGDPQKATWEKGRIICEYTARVMRKWLRKPLS